MCKQSSWHRTVHFLRDALCASATNSQINVFFHRTIEKYTTVALCLGLSCFSIHIYPGFLEYCLLWLLLYFFQIALAPETFLALATIISLLAVSIPAALSGNVLLFPQPLGEHEGACWGAYSRGHTVTIIWPADNWYISKMSPHYTTVTVVIVGGPTEDFFSSLCDRSY